MSDRYEGKPFLRLVDSYVLDAIGALDEANQRWLKDYEPDLQNAYAMQGTWQDIVAAQMRFPAGLPETIREVWEKGTVKFREATGEEPDPVQFTIQFVDKNFPH